MFGFLYVYVHFCTYESLLNVIKLPLAVSFQVCQSEQYSKKSYIILLRCTFFVCCIVHQITTSIVKAQGETSLVLKVILIHFLFIPTIPFIANILFRL